MDSIRHPLGGEGPALQIVELVLALLILGSCRSTDVFRATYRLQHTRFDCRARAQAHALLSNDLQAELRKPFFNEIGLELLGPLTKVEADLQISRTPSYPSSYFRRRRLAQNTWRRKLTSPARGTSRTYQGVATSRPWRAQGKLELAATSALGEC